jgi:hypothetical protein
MSAAILEKLRDRKAYRRGPVYDVPTSGLLRDGWIELREQMSDTCVCNASCDEIADRLR